MPLVPRGSAASGGSLVGRTRLRASGVCRTLGCYCLESCAAPRLIVQTTRGTHRLRERQRLVCRTVVLRHSPLPGPVFTPRPASRHSGVLNLGTRYRCRPLSWQQHPADRHCPDCTRRGNETFKQLHPSRAAVCQGVAEK